MNAAIAAGVKNVVVLSTDKAAYPINAMGISKAMMEKLAVAKSRVAAERGCTIAITRYGNVMASRGSVIPLFVDQIREGKSLTVTDPYMTRFMMSIDDAVDLVLYAFQHAEPGDLFVQKAPAATIETLALAMNAIFQVDSPIQIIGTRHGEKEFETLLTREEMLRAVDLGGYYRVPADNRDLNYDAYFVEGSHQLSELADYNSHNTRRLNREEMVDTLYKLDYIRNEISTWRTAKVAIA
jgi:UDP-glucose 4-epimerase